MSLFRRLITAGLSFLLLVVLLVGVPLSALSRTLTNEATVTGILGSEEVYSKLRAAADDLPLNQLGEGNANTDSQAFFDKKAFEPLVDKYLDYEFYQRSISAVTSAVFDWLEGSTPDLEFTIQITEDRTEFKKLFVDILLARYRSFPPCPAGIPAELEQVFTNECRLPQVEAKQLRAVIERELSNSDLDQLINNATITSGELADNINSQDAERAKELYRLASNLPLIIAGLAIIISGLIALVVYNKRRIWRALGGRFLIPGVTLLVGSLLLRLGSGPLIDQSLNSAEDNEQAFVDVAQTFTGLAAKAMANRAITYSLVLIAVGGGAIILQKVLNKEPINLLPRSRA